MYDDIRNYTAEELAQFDEAFSATQVDERDDYGPVPDGKYQVSIEKAEITRTKTNNIPMLSLILRILAPTHVNRILWRNYVIKTETLKWLKQDLYTCGLQITRLSDLPHNLDQLINTRLEIKKVTKGDMENIYINRKLELTMEGGRHDGYVGSDDVPF